jgi:hypothetical protein
MKMMDGKKGEIDSWMFVEKRKGNGCVSIFFRCVMLLNRITFICHGEAAGKSGTSGKNMLVVRGAIGLSEINS